MLLDSVDGLDSCIDNLELFEVLPELDDFPLWCEELCEEETLFPFLPFSFELELLLRILSGVLSKSSRFKVLDWCSLSDLLESLELMQTRADNS